MREQRNSLQTVPLVASLSRERVSYKGGSDMGYRVYLRSRELKQGSWYNDLKNQWTRNGNQYKAGPVILRLEHVKTDRSAFHGLRILIPITSPFNDPPDFNPKLDRWASGYKSKSGGFSVYVPLLYLTRRDMGPLPTGYWQGTATIRPDTPPGFVEVRLFSMDQPHPADTLARPE